VALGSPNSGLISAPQGSARSEELASGPATGWKFRPDIEGLRAVAIIGVILFHAGVRWLPGGFLGVDVFFVLSGFLITGILIAEGEKTGTISLAEFWARRARRLLPAATLVSLATLLLSARFDAPFLQGVNARSAIAFATYWSNLLFVRRGADYFDQTLARDPFLHTWSLAVEEQYYLVFAPLCLLLTLRLWGGGNAQFRRRALICAAAVTATSFVGCLVLTAWKPLISFYGLPARAWEFGIGGMIALMKSRGNQSASRLRGAVAIAGLAALLASWFLATERTPHPGWVTLLPVLGTAALVATGGGEGRTVVGRLLETPVMRWLGRLSYSWYLWHWPVGIYWEKLVWAGTVPVVIVMPLVSLALAQLTYVAIEAPARGVPWLRRTQRGLAVALVLAVVTTVAGVVSLRDSRIRLRDPRFAFIIEAHDTPTRLHREDCHLELSEVEPKVGQCVYGRPNADTTVVLMGDSHAAQWFAALEPIAADRGWRIIPMTKSACPAMSVTVRVPSAQRAYVECDHWRESVFERLPALKPTLIVLASSDWYDIAETNGQPGRAGSVTRFAKPTSTVWQRGLQATLDRLPRSSAILVLADTPRPRFDVPTCLFEHVDDVDRCAFRRDAAFADDLRRAESDVARGDSRVRYLDLSDAICDGPMCAAARGTLATFSDASHLSVRYAASLAPLLRAAFDSMLARDKPRSPGYP
jgi:peptidoglycan/LPS O-acetylase OafA/YrhL